MKRILLTLVTATILFSCTKTPNTNIINNTKPNKSYVCDCRTMERHIGIGGSTYTYSDELTTISGVDSTYAASICSSHDKYGALQNVTCTLK